EVEAAAVRYRAVLEQRAVTRRVVLEELRILAQRNAKGGDRFFVALVAEVGIAEIAVKHRHVIAYLDGLFVSLDGLAVFLALIPDRSDVVFGVGVVRIILHGP